MPARIVLNCWGSYGDLFPYLGLAIRLKAAGHAPVVATCPFYRDLVEAEGIEFRSIRPDIDPGDTALMARVMDPSRGSQIVVNEMVMPFIDEAHQDLFDATRDADAIVSHPVTFAARIVAEERGLPWLSTVLAPASFFSTHDFPALPPFPRLAAMLTSRPWAAARVAKIARHLTRGWAEPVHALRRARGLPPAGHPLFEGQFSPHGTLALFSRVMAAAQPDWPPRTTVTGFVFYNRPAALTAEVEAFLDGGDPPIVFTLGSSAVGVPGGFYDESIHAARSIGRRALLMVRMDVGSRLPARLPPEVMATDYAPHELVFPRAAAIVHHGGAGTTGQALRAGRPMLVVPHAHDQPDNAARVVRYGAGRALDARRYRAAGASRHLHALLTDPAYARRASEAAAIVRTESGAASAVACLDALLSASGAIR